MLADESKINFEFLLDGFRWKAHFQLLHPPGQPSQRTLGSNQKEVRSQHKIILVDANDNIIERYCNIPIQNISNNTWKYLHRVKSIGNFSFTQGHGFLCGTAPRCSFKIFNWEFQISQNISDSILCHFHFVRRRPLYSSWNIAFKAKPPNQKLLTIFAFSNL